MNQGKSDSDKTVDDGTALKATQLAAIGAMMLVSLSVPLTIGELFPFTNSPEFADSPEVYCRYKVHSLADNQALLFDSKYHSGPEHITETGNREFGLQQIRRRSTRSGVGVLPPRTVNVIGKIASESEVKNIVESNLIRMGYKTGVRVEQIVYGAVNDQRVGELETNQWLVEIPPELANAAPN